MAFTKKIRHSDALSATKQKLLDELIDGNYIGLCISEKYQRDDEKLSDEQFFEKMLRAKNFQRNCRIIPPLREEPKPQIFYHGRDVFSPEFAQEYFSPGYDKSKAPFEAFGERARIKIHATVNQIFDPRFHKIAEAERRDIEISMLRNIASSIPNPYDERFIAAEKAAARLLVDSVHPRVLRSAMRGNAVMLMTDAHGPLLPDYMLAFPDVTQQHQIPGIEGVSGTYCKKYEWGSPEENCFIIIGAKGFNIDRAGTTVRHEFEHCLDDHSRRRFADTNTDDLKEKTKRDRQHFEALKMLVETVSNQSPQLDQNKVMELAAALMGESPKSLLLAKQSLSATLHKISEKVNSCLLRPDGKGHGSYNTSYKQLAEILPVMEELKAQYDKNFIEALLPETYEAVRQHRYRNSLLRDDPSIVTQQAR